MFRSRFDVKQFAGNGGICISPAQHCRCVTEWLIVQIAAVAERTALKRSPQLFFCLLRCLAARKLTGSLLSVSFAVKIEETVSQIVAKECVPITGARPISVRKKSIRNSAYV